MSTYRTRRRQHMQEQQTDFVDYPSGGMPYGQYGQYPQNYQMPPQSGGNDQDTAKKGCSPGCGIMAMIIFVLAFVIGAYVMVSSPKELDLSSLKMIDAEVTDVYVNTHTVTEYEDGEETTYQTTEYDLTYEYSYGGNTYTGTGTSEFPKHKGDTIHIFINPESPEKSYYFGKFIYLLCVCAVCILLCAVILYSSLRKARRRRRNS